MEINSRFKLGGSVIRISIGDNSPDFRLGVLIPEEFRCGKYPHPREICRRLTVSDVKDVTVVSGYELCGNFKFYNEEFAKSIPPEVG